MIRKLRLVLEAEVRPTALGDGEAATEQYISLFPFFTIGNAGSKPALIDSKPFNRNGRALFWLSTANRYWVISMLK